MNSPLFQHRRCPTLFPNLFTYSFFLCSLLTNCFFSSPTSLFSLFSHHTSDYENIILIFSFLLCTILWGILTYSTEPDTWNSGNTTNATTTTVVSQKSNNATISTFRPVDSKRMGPAMTMITLLLLFTMMPLIEHFNTLRSFCQSNSIHMPIHATIAILLHVGLHLFIWLNWQSGRVTKTSLATLLSFLMYPSLILMGIGMYKWRDEKWLAGRYYKKETATRVAIYIGSSQVVILAFDIIVGALYSWAVGIILLFLHVSFLLILACLVKWVMMGFFLPKGK